MIKINPKLIILFCTLLVVGLAVIKLTMGESALFNQGFFLLILVSAFLKNERYTMVCGIISIVIMLGAAIYKPPAEPHLWINLIATIIAIIISVAVLIYMKRTYLSIEADGKQLNALFQFTNEGIVLFDSDGKILLINPQALSLFGYQKEEITGRPLHTLLPDRFVNSFHKFSTRFKNEQLDGQVEQLTDVLLLKKSGMEFITEIKLGFYSQHKMLYIVAFIKDLTTQRESERKMVTQNELLERITYDIRKMNIELENKVSQRTLILQEALHELERSQTELSEALNKEKELNEIKSRFVSMASHEFRTPLSTVLSSASLISKYHQFEDQEKRERHIRRIKDSVKHLNDLLEDFLSMGKLEEGRVVTEVVVFDIKEFMLDVFDEMRMALKEGQELKLNCEGEPIFVTDKRLLKNVMINLLSNAIKFSDVNSSIFVNVDNSGSRLILQIQDSGIGIPEEDLPHLFSTFYRGRNATNIQGTGLGLHIVKRYVNMLEGEITLNSDVNKGTTFNIGLPNLQAQASV